MLQIQNYPQGHENTPDGRFVWELHSKFLQLSSGQNARDWGAAGTSGNRKLTLDEIRSMFWPNVSSSSELYTSLWRSYWQQFMAIRQLHKAVCQIFLGRFTVQEHKIPKINTTERHMMAQHELEKPTRALKSQVRSWLCTWSQRNKNKIFMHSYNLFFTRNIHEKRSGIV